VRITVEDDGDGVPRRIEPFSLFATTKRDGAGLGLAIAKEIVGAHGGEIEYRSTRRGGSEFAVDLPVKPPIEAL
jgi:signal transduction histidine kinase